MTTTVATRWWQGQCWICNLWMQILILLMNHMNRVLSILISTGCFLWLIHVDSQDFWAGSSYSRFVFLGKICICLDSWPNAHQCVEGVNAKIVGWRQSEFPGPPNKIVSLLTKKQQLHALKFPQISSISPKPCLYSVK